MDKNFVVYKSSAGSGKTFTLVKEYLKLILKQEDPAYYKKILAITFTNKAAAEMKERIMKMLKVFSEPQKLNSGAETMLKVICDELKQEEPYIRKKSDAIFKSMLHNYSDISISTIDKFTYKIIRTFAHDLKIPLNFELQLEEDEILKHAVESLIAKAGKDERLTKVLVDFTENNIEEEKSKNIENEIIRFARKLTREESIRHLQNLSAVELEDFMKFREHILKKIKEFENHLQALGAMAWNVIKDTGLTHDSFFQKDKGIAKYFERIALGNLEKLDLNSYQEKAFSEDKWYGKISKQEQQAIDSIKNELTNIYMEISSFIDAHHTHYKTISAINENFYSLGLLNQLQKQVDEYKQENNVLHISEFNKRIAETIVHEPAPFIYERLGERYKHFLVDEFQDTSELQFLNLLPLIDNSLAEAQFTMLVGDAKQSIYRWRGGEAEQFVNLPSIKNKWEDKVLDDRGQSLKRNYEARNLNKNFRSKYEIVDFNNKFFRAAAHKLHETHKVTYEGLEQEYNSNNEGGFIRIEFLPKDSDIDADEASLQKTVEWIHELENENYEYKDIAILTRGNKEGSLLAEKLIANKIPVISSESLLLANSAEVRFLMAWVELLNENQNKVALSEIVNYLFNNSLIDYSSLHEALSNNKTAGQLELNLQKHRKNISLGKLYQLNLYELIETLIYSFELNKKADPYLLFFMDALWSFTGKQNQGIKDLLTWWADKQHKLSLVLPEGINAVRIMTIHKSKGLEFPAVLIPFANWRTLDSQKNLWVDVDVQDLPELKSAIVKHAKRLEETDYSDVYTEEDEKSKLDHLNMLYVAFTRPSERLYILSTMPSGFNKIADYYVDYLKQEIVWDENKTVYEFGNRKNHEAEKKEKEETKVMNDFYAEAIGSKIKIASQIEKENEHGTMKKIVHGNIVHELLSQVNHGKDNKILLKRYVTEGIISDSEAEEIIVSINKIITNETIKPFFNPASKTLNEKEIMLGTGEVIRPDRVIIENEKAIIVDFKTGKPNSRYHQQLQKYAAAMSQLGFREVEKYLVYTEELKVEKIR